MRGSLWSFATAKASPSMHRAGTSNGSAAQIWLPWTMPLNTSGPPGAQKAAVRRSMAGAVATAAWLAGKIEAENPVLMVSGGNVATQTAAAILARR